MKKLIISCCMVSTMFFGGSLWAQPDPPPPPTPLPGLALLAAAGCALGAKKIFRSSEEES